MHKEVCWVEKIKTILFLFIISFGKCAYADYDLTKLKNYSFELERTPPVIPPFLACYKKDDRELCYIATNHGTDQNSATFKLVRDVIEDFKPNLVIIEGFETKKGESPSDINELVEKFCKVNPSVCEEPHYAVSQASSKNIPFIGGEPDDEEVYDKLRYEGYSKNDVFAFYFARLVPQLYREGQVSNMEDVHKKFDEYLKVSSVSGVTLTYPEYEDWMKRNISPSIGFDEMKDPKFVAPFANGNKLQEIANKNEWIRDRHILKVIFDSVLKYKRVLVIYGHSHFLTQIDVLEQHLGKPTYLERYSK